MKPPAFEYHDPHTVGDALGLLAERGENGKVLAGGQSLVPLLNFRLAYPENLIDINNLGGLNGIRRRGGSLRIGAVTRQSRLEHSRVVAEGWPLLTEAVNLVAHAQIRNRGTVGGSVAHADPAAELPVAMAALEAKAHVASRRGRRTIAASELFVTHLTTSLEPDELLVELEVPELPERTGHAFEEFARRHGDFALGGAAVLITSDASGSCTRAAISLLGAAPTPIRASEAEADLIGTQVDEEAVEHAAKRAVASIEPTGDIHGSSEYRKGLIGALTKRALVTAAARSRGEQAEGGN